jgi:hypothetical protein
MIVLDLPTMKFCAELARNAANGIPRERSHYDVARGTLEAFADELESMMPTEKESPL